ncbi:membrane protein insertion efficiency factor YidD [Candidatus Peregrinibacteria bacterium]|nr:membrane protein insertion efficiency factor YidD [Candidatus Peregrinibacteria bacterium]
MVLNKIQLITSNYKKRGPLDRFLYLPRIPFLLLIMLYQKLLSPDHSWLRHLFPHGYCRFHPSCSEYGFGIIEKRGLIKGIPLAVWRVLRCNPWNDGGEDPF